MTSAKVAARVIRDLAGVPSQTSGRVAARFSEETQKGFDKGVDPHGRPWASLAPATIAKGRTPPPLTDTGRGRRGVRFRPMQGSGIAMTSSVGYMARHQSGDPGGNLPARPFLPGHRLPRKWEKIAEEEYQKAVDERLAKLT